MSLTLGFLPLAALNCGGVWICFEAAEAYSIQGIKEPCPVWTSHGLISLTKGDFWKASSFQGHLGLRELAVSGRLEDGKEFFTQGVLRHVGINKGILYLKSKHKE